MFSKQRISNGDVAALRDLDWTEILQAQRKIGKDILSENHHVPVSDGVSIPRDWKGAMKSGFAKNVPLMIGHVSDELPVFEGFINSKNLIVRNLAKRMVSNRLVSYGLKKEYLHKALEFYRDELQEGYVPNKEYDQLITDLGFRLPSILVAETHCTNNVGTYFYEFAYKAPLLGVAVHVLDLFFVFGTLDTTDVSDEMKFAQSDEEKRLSKIMMDAWINFARTGNPNHDDLPNWQEYDSENRFIMMLDVEPKLVAKHLENRIRFWKSLSLM